MNYALSVSFSKINKINLTTKPIAISLFFISENDPPEQMKLVGTLHNTPLSADFRESTVNFLYCFLSSSCFEKKKLTRSVDLTYGNSCHYPRSKELFSVM